MHEDSIKISLQEVYAEQESTLKSLQLKNEALESQLA